MAGIDECACCADSPAIRDEETGFCGADCAGSWSDTCSSDCVLNWTETVAQSGQGAACPSAPSCPAGEGDCPHTCSSIEASCTRTCEASGDYSQCDLQTPTVRDCVANEELAECLPANQLSASNRA